MFPCLCARVRPHYRYFSQKMPVGLDRWRVTFVIHLA